VRLHGGPHAAANSAFTTELALLLTCGVAVLLPNYRGSLGYGKTFAEALLGQAGLFDVDDCAALTSQALQQHGESLDAARVAAYGGSHGGFLAGWLAGHPVHRQLYCASVLWNPVTNIAAMVAATEIPEWCTAEALGKDLSRPLSAEDVATLYTRSPISVAGNVECPILMVIGASDQRVPPLNGREYVATLQAQGKAVTAYQYPDNGHAIAGPEANAHVVTTIVAWLWNQLKE